MAYGQYVHLNVDEVVQETEKALLLRLEDGEEVWVPISQIADAEQYGRGDLDCVISVTDWFAKKEGLG